MTRILQILTDFILFYLYLCKSVLICVIRVLYIYLNRNFYTFHLHRSNLEFYFFDQGFAQHLVDFCYDIAF